SQKIWMKKRHLQCRAKIVKNETSSPDLGFKCRLSSGSFSTTMLCALKVEPSEPQQLSRPANKLIWREDNLLY
ncbi:hypothetical protein CHARACLAT_017864, partial [Characodon lateralis]|nr:hypothetical protein [Characodon lateralis]